MAYLVRLIKLMADQVLGGDSENTKFIERYKEQESVETHDRQRPKLTRHIKEDLKKNTNDFFPLPAQLPFNISSCSFFCM